MDSKTFFHNFETIANAPGGVARLRELILRSAGSGTLLGIEKPIDHKNKKSLGDICEIYQPRTISKNELIENGEFLVYGANGVIGRYDKYNHEFEEVLVTCRGATCGTVNVSAPKSWINGNAMVVRPKIKGLTKQFLAVILQGLDYQSVITGTAQPQITRQPLSKILIYVPSIDEQKRIVAKVDVLMELCDELEAAQQRRNSIHTAARKSAIDAISIATTPDELDLAWKRISNNWTTIADTPESIASLRLLILDLAVRGSLVEQGVIGLSAAEVTKSMRQKRQADIQLMKRSERKKDAAQSNQPQLAPSHWKKGLLGEVCLIVMGNSPPGDSYSEVERGVPLINGPVEFSRSPLGMTLRTKFTSKPTYMCKKGDILVCVRGATTGRTNIAGFDACIGRGVALVRGYESQKFINLFMWNIGTVLLAAGKGTTFPSISYDDLANLEIAIPPLDEQERLVAKVESLMDMCDELERSLHIRNELTKKIASAMTAEVAA